MEDTENKNWSFYEEEEIKNPDKSSKKSFASTWHEPTDNDLKEQKHTSQTQANKVQAQAMIQSVSDLQAWLINQFGESVFEQIQTLQTEQKQLSGQTLEENAPPIVQKSTREWLAETLDHLFKNKALFDNLVEKLNTQLAKQNTLQSENEQLKAQLSLLEKEYNRKEQETAIAQSDKFLAEKALQTMFSIQVVADSITENAMKNKALTALQEAVQEAVENPEKETAGFLLAFSKVLPLVQLALATPTTEESVLMEQMHQASKQIMIQLAGKHIVYRRPILDSLAGYMSSFFSQFDFVSPEHSLQVDPAIHNTERIQGNTIREGRSFIVVRRENRKTVKYADIVV